MSKNIWHKPSETTDVDNNLIIDDWTNGTYELGYFDDKDMIFRNFRNDDIHDEESMMRWCDVDELIDDYNRTRKALECIKKVVDGWGCGNMHLPDYHDGLIIAEIVNETLEQKDVK